MKKAEGILEEIRGIFFDSYTCALAGNTLPFCFLFS
jgi:hypothetical protein